ncbi:hypothetical protein OV090_07505 [Nannocystis sp. RBIL2]|uniref:hypothetical protein n=1 Tax=Nannocystis sp. RBIL2 TaxID=2996788 RepID=UPI0022713064|nr:hypothetical protein [Nannocystis sp. RBIL2]MCY1064601.1 hypothetical protein [Nannocystis sp. RBIL2]
MYAAYDEHLDRKVAIKPLRTDAAPRRELLRARLLREAKLMAQLSHPNVIAVHEAGAHEGQMEVRYVLRYPAPSSVATATIASTWTPPATTA